MLLAYWGYALSHAVFLANRRYYSTIRMTPYQVLRHTQPDLTGLRAFGAKCYFKHTRTNQANMDNVSQTGIFVGYTNTMKNVYVISDKTHKP